MAARGEDPINYRDRIATVDADGGRVWVYPKFIRGVFMKRRQVLSYVLIAFLFAGPWLSIGGEPLLQLDVIHRKFVILGQVFWPQDSFLFALAMVTAVVLVIVFTVVFGRLFCGWVCPQTVFLEFIFRPIERLIEGDRNARIRLDKGPWTREKVWKKGLKWVTYYGISFAIANTFLAYIIGKEELMRIQADPPSEHIGGLLALMGFSLVFYFVFARLREQVCTSICPYGRLQGVLVDRDTVNVTYDYVRGEPRGHRKRGASEEELAAQGDCVDCGLCIQVCPTNIDIRNGVQLECVHCTACIDACDSIMEKLAKPGGLIRYASENSIAQKKPFALTGRAKAYIGVLFVLSSVFFGLIFFRSPIEMNVFRTAGSMYQIDDAGHISNLYRYALVNKSNDTLRVTLAPDDQRFTLELVGEDVLVVPASEMVEGVFFLRTPLSELSEERAKFKLILSDSTGVIAKAKTEFPGPIPGMKH